MAKKKSTRRQSHGYTYFVVAHDVNMVKIGFSAYSIGSRLDTLQTGSPVKLELVCVIEGPRSLEKDLHQRFAEDRSHLEWFHLTEQIQAYMESECEPCPKKSNQPNVRAPAPKLQPVEPPSIYPMYHDTQSGRQQIMSRRDWKRFGR